MAGKSDAVRIAETKARLEKRFGVEPAKQPDPWDEPDDNIMGSPGDAAIDEADMRNPRISLSLGVTLPTGNYGSTRVDVGLTIDRLTGRSTDETFSWLEEVLMDKLDHAMDKLLEHIQ